MRLLRTQEYHLVEANDLPTPFPEYAILSHTWISPKDEINYQDFKQRKSDIENDIFKQKGWAKLRRYCDRAARDGWEWAWMDTCCIDKTNPADTQEAINAMFRWYQNAGICYAYLDDVDVDKVVDCPNFDLDDIAGRDNVADPTSFPHLALKAFLIKAKWFTRGWTLQELLAPPYLVFVDQAWRRIGTRESWADEIKQASRIEARHLTNFSPTDFISCSIAMRFSWASRRLTTVEEDETYSLLGLFGISLPLIYGEGRWRAFNRLQRELITVYNDDSIFAWKFEQSRNMRAVESQEKANEHGRGILAPSIREYWDASNIEALGLYGNSFAMTNQGLEIKAKRWTHKDDPTACLIRLNCGPGAENQLGSNRLAIRLKRVNDSYDRIKLDEIHDMSTIRLADWEEESSQEPTVIRASNYSNVAISSSIFALKYPEQIKIGKKYFVDFDSSHGTPMRLLDDSDPTKGLTKDELMMGPSRLVFINIELQSEAPTSKLDVIINLSDKSFPSVGIYSRGQEPRERLGDPLDESMYTYEHLADYLHYKVASEPAYQAVAVDEREGAVVSVCLLPRPRQRRTFQRPADKTNSATSREYVLKITVQHNGDNDEHVLERLNKKRRLDH
ncbi:hypothetical protein KJ359_002995 [Pestalotiopsis sp. 9143b]|nr:hypothetical protein KJ359_002995 [Pestalotiopsis sp. 9143b]